MATGICGNYCKMIGKQIVARSRGQQGWYGPHMSAASRAIAERIPLVDFVLEVRDARVPLSSEYEKFGNLAPSARRIIVMNKMDLANRSQLKEWIKYFEQQNCVSYAVNSHNKDNVKQFLNFLQAQVRELKRTDQSSHTTTMMIVGIPNVGKSALANSLHQIGRISAAERGKLKHAIVSPEPGGTKDICSMKIGSHPNIYVLDTPGILPWEICGYEICAKLALTGAIGDYWVGAKELARYFLAILNLSDEYKKWAKLSTQGNDRSLIDQNAECSSGCGMDMKRKRQYPADHTQDFIVHDVRLTLFEAINCFTGNLQKEKDLEKLIEVQLTALVDAFRVSADSADDTCIKVSAKLLNLYRTGRLGHYTLDTLGFGR